MASSGIQLDYHQAVRVGQSVLAELGPVINRGFLAGSTRRLKQRGIADLDFVIEPKGDAAGWSPAFLHVIRHCPRWSCETKSLGPQSRQIKLRSAKNAALKLELYLTTADRLGWILMLRTGPTEFGRSLVQQVKRLPIPHFFDDGALWRGRSREDAVMIPTPDEESVFAALGLDYIAPDARTERRLLWMTDRIRDQPRLAGPHQGA